MKFTLHIVLILLFSLVAVNSHAQDDLFVTQESRRPALYDSTALYISSFTDFKPDFKRICGITIIASGSKWMATCTERPFVPEDVGKILVVKNARSYRVFIRMPVTLNSVIIAVNNGQAEINNFDGTGTIIAVTGQCGFVATDNFEVMQRAIDSCAAKGKTRLRMNYTGTAYLVPFRTSRLMPSSDQKSLVVNSNLEIRGYDSSLTKLKWGIEDISRTDHAATPYYSSFWIQNCKFGVKKMSLLSPDRSGFNLDNLYLECLHGDANNKLGQDILVDSSAITNEDKNSFYGWGAAIYQNGAYTSSALDTAFQSVTNSFLLSQGGLSFFSPAVNTSPSSATLTTDTMNRLQRIQNTTNISGAPYCIKATGAEIQIGSNIVTVHDPSFSFYSLTDYELIGYNSRDQYICITKPGYNFTQQGDTTTVYWSQVLQVLNDSMAVVDTAARVGARFQINGRMSYSTSSTNVSGDVNTQFLNDLYPGDELYSNGFGNPYIGTVQSIISNNQLVLINNALLTVSNDLVLTPSTSLFIPAQYGYYNHQMRRHSPRWSTTTGTLYTLRRGGHFAAFHCMYVSGNLGSNNKNIFLQALRNGRRVANLCYSPISICGSCLANDSGIVIYEHPTWYPAGGDVKIILNGTGYGRIVSSTYEYAPVAPQKR